MRKLTKAGLGVIGAASIVLPAALPASADIGPTGNDVVGVGSDTVQNLLNFVADGRSGATPHNGYNFNASKNRLVSFDATPDENDRAGYLNGSSSAGLKPLQPTVILRAGAHPVQRPNGSGAAIKALIADSTHQISFIRMSRAPKAAEIASAQAATGVGDLRVVQLGTEHLQMAANATTNAPSGLSKAQLKGIYECTITTWDQVGGTGTGTIVPLLPQDGSGTHDTFLSDIGEGSTYSPPSCVKRVEENDPFSLREDTAGSGTNASGATANEIAPFSGSRKALYDSGYFNDPSKTFDQAQVTLSSGIQILTGAPSDTQAVYDDNRSLYVVFRQSDATSTTPFQPGSAKNWAQDLFVIGNIANPTQTAIKPYVASAAGLANIGDSGATAAYLDKGTNFSVG